MLSDSKMKYGDLGMRDAGDNLLYRPTLGEAAKYLFGFRPKVLSQKKQAQAMTAFAEQRGTQQYGSTLDEYSRSLLSGDPSEAMRYAYSVQAGDPTVDPKGILQSMVKRAVDATTERDLLAQGSRASEGERAKIAGLFPQGVVNRQSELQRTILGIQLGAQVGLAPEGRQVEQAGIVDALIRNNPSMPRSQALRLAEMLH